jgi:hypothetical protein
MNHDLFFFLKKRLIKNQTFAVVHTIPMILTIKQNKTKNPRKHRLLDQGINQS